MTGDPHGREAEDPFDTIEAIVEEIHTLVCEVEANLDTRLDIQELTDQTQKLAGKAQELYREVQKL